MGPFKIIGSSYQNIYGPNRSHRQHLPFNYWAYARLLAAAARKSMGPFKAIGSISQKEYGPIQGHRQQYKWAHSISLMAVQMGPC
jgi:hypothetical protein